MKLEDLLPQEDLSKMTTQQLEEHIEYLRKLRTAPRSEPRTRKARSIAKKAESKPIARAVKALASMTVEELELLLKELEDAGAEESNDASTDS